MLFYYIYKMTWAYDKKKLSYHLNQVFFKFDVSYHVSYTIPVKTINNGKTQVKSHEFKVPLLEVISTYDLALSPKITFFWALNNGRSLGLGFPPHTEIQ